MTFLPTKEIDWTSSDALRLREFLESPVGQRAIALVVDDAPALLDGSDVHRTLVASGKVEGFNKALTALFRLTVEKPTPANKPKDNYPDLEDEDAWKENPIITPKPTKPTT